eukprot:471277_1
MLRFNRLSLLSLTAITGTASCCHKNRELFKAIDPEQAQQFLQNNNRSWQRDLENNSVHILSLNIDGTALDLHIIDGTEYDKYYINGKGRFKNNISLRGKWNIYVDPKTNKQKVCIYGDISGHHHCRNPCCYKYDEWEDQMLEKHMFKEYCIEMLNSKNVDCFILNEYAQWIKTNDFKL